MSLEKMINDYSSERGVGPKVLFKETAGYATYHITDDECYIEDIYVVPEKRKDHIAKNMADEISAIAKDLGCGVLTGSVCLADKNAETNKKVLLAYGMMPLKESDGMEYYWKEIL